MLRNRKGVTLMEIMTVVVLTSVIMAITFPSMKDTKRAASMQSARTQVESYLAVARSVAVRSGVRAYLVRNGNTLTILADSANGPVPVVRSINLDEVSGVLLTSSSGLTADTIVYDNRGIATNLGASGGKFYLTFARGYGAGAKDSICVTRLGATLDKQCGLSVPTPDKEIPVDTGGGIIVDPIDKGGAIDPTPITQDVTQPITQTVNTIIK
jgi:prepilin-type N-terminal cleavage/methylation domain-containing protein